MRLLLLALFALLGLFTAQASAQLPPEIARLPLIRIGVDYAPGNGHQAASATVVQRLREFGYSGQIEIIYPSRDSTKHKLSFLFPPFDKIGPEDQTFPEQKLRLISIEFFRAYRDRFQDVPLAITGAHDHAMEPGIFRARALLQLQPYGWFGTGLLLWRPRSGSERFETIASLASQPYLFQLPNPSNVMTFLQQQMGNTNLKPKIPGLTALLDLASRHAFAPLYGHDARSQIIRYTAAVLRAMDNHPHLFPKGVVLPILNELTLTDLEVLYMTLASAPVKKRVQISDITAPQLPAQLQSLAANEVLLVHTGPVPKAVFEYLYTQSTLPPLVRGLNSINLMQLIGRPYLPSVQAEHYPFEAPIQAQRAWQAMITHEAKAAAFKANDTETARVADFIVASLTEGSEVNHAFARHKLDPNRLDRDKVHLGLKAVASLINNDFVMPQEAFRLLKPAWANNPWVRESLPTNCKSAAQSKRSWSDILPF